MFIVKVFRCQIPSCMLRPRRWLIVNIEGSGCLHSLNILSSIIFSFSRGCAGKLKPVEEFLHFKPPINGVIDNSLTGFSTSLDDLLRIEMFGHTRRDKSIRVLQGSKFVEKM
jgi:hypothetical protein